MLDFIKNNLFIKYKKSIGLNSSRLKQQWFINNNYENIYHNIIEYTNFLDEKNSLSERIYCILHNIKSKNKCPYCNNKVKYANFNEGYRRHCGNRECSYKDKKHFLDKNGLTANEKTSIGVKISQLKIEDNGKTKAQNSSIKSVDTKRNTIINGKNMIQISIEKSNNTKMNTILPNGLTISKYASLKSSNTMNKKLLNGKTIKEVRIQKMIKTKSELDDNGLDSFDKGFLNGAGKNSSIKYYNDELYYQGTYEKHFLDFMFNNNIKNIERGERFDYKFNNKLKQYRSDFKIGNNIFEIKSSWTYGKNDNIRRSKNHTKFKSVIDSGFNLFVILDKKYYIQIKSINIDDNLYDKKLELFENILLKITKKN